MPVYLVDIYSFTDIFLAGLIMCIIGSRLPLVWKTLKTWKCQRDVRKFTKSCQSVGHRRNNHRDQGRLVPQLLGWGTNNVLVPQLLGRNFQKARNFTAGSHQNAGFSIWVFKSFLGVIPRTLTAGGGNPQPVGHKRPGVGTQILVPLNYSAVVAPLVSGKKFVDENWLTVLCGTGWPVLFWSVGHETNVLLFCICVFSASSLFCVFDLTTVFQLHISWWEWCVQDACRAAAKRPLGEVCPRLSLCCRSDVW